MSKLPIHLLSQDRGTQHDYFYFFKNNNHKKKNPNLFWNQDCSYKIVEGKEIHMCSGSFQTKMLKPFYL